MKCTIPEISWHNRDPVLSIDVQPSKTGTVISPYRLATGGTDSHVVIWYVTIKDCGLASVEVAADLQRHQRAVNTVRFSPSGQFLASGDDESVIIVWKPKTEHDISDLTNTDGEVSKEQWVSMKILRGHLEDVYDLSWSLDSVHLISGSIDNTAIIWDVQKGRNLGLLTGHGGFVQGVAWDPKNRYAATLSSDRTCRIHNISTNKVKAKVSKAPLPVPPGSELSGKIMRLFHDDTLKSFFRRLSFSPDGELLVTPSGVIEIPNSEKHISATYIFSRYDFSRPVVYLPSPREYTVAVRFCPLLFKLREGSSLFALPYRMVFAVATKSNVILYDTQQSEPIALITNIHYTRLTDLSWSSDGQVLIASSTDGYCSIITFSEEELGEIYELSSTNVESENESANLEKRPSDSIQVSSQGQQGLLTANTVCDSVKEKENTQDTNKTELKTIVTPTTVHIHSENEDKNSATRSVATHIKDKKSPRRIALITLSSPRKRVTNTPISDPKKPICQTVQSRAATTTHNEAVNNGNPLKSVSDGTCSREISSSEATVEKPTGEDGTEPMQTDETTTLDSGSKENQAGEEIVSQEIIEEPMEAVTTCDKVGSPNKLSRAATTNDIKERSNNCAGEESEIEMKSESHKDNSEKNNINKKENECKSEGFQKSLLKKDQNDDDAEVDNERNKVQNTAIKSCEKSPEKIPVNSCETTPSKYLSDQMQTECTGTPSCASDEVSEQKEVSCNVTPVEKRTPRRVQFITISSPKKLSGGVNVYLGQSNTVPLYLE